MTDTDDPHDWIDALLPYGHTKEFKLGETIVVQGQENRMVYFVLSGKVKAVTYSEQGQETWLDVFVQGALFGHAWMLTQSMADCEIVAEVGTQLLQISAYKFQELMKTEAGFSKMVSRDLGKRLNLMSVRLVEATTLSSPGRVCAELMRLSNPIGIDTTKLIVRPNPVFTELARRINSTRETVSRTVSRLAKEGVIKRETGAILILKPDALKSKIF